MLDSRRSNAITRLMQIAQAQEKYFLDKNSYAKEISDLHMGDWQGDDNDSIAFSNTSGELYSITASIESTSAQASDTGCASMRLNNMNQRSPGACLD